MFFCQSESCSISPSALNRHSSDADAYHPKPSALNVDNRYDTDAEGPAQGVLPPGAPSDVLARFEVSGAAEAAEKYNDTESVKVSAHFRADVSGLLSLDRVEAVVEYSTQVATKVHCG